MVPIEFLRPTALQVLDANPLQKLKPIRTDGLSRARYLTAAEECALRSILTERDERLRNQLRCQLLNSLLLFRSSKFGGPALTFPMETTSRFQLNAFADVVNDAAHAHDRAIVVLVRIVVVHVVP